ncbi:MAG: hypothetical protein MJ056_07410 [Akkermansia sp.]|nr:hypothetical protein [Akkermansia sp.]
MLARALVSLTPAFADVKYDALRPQEIITVAEGQTISNSDPSFTVDLSQEQIGKKTNNRTAIAKDGQGTLVLDQEVDMFCSLVVREGTLLIKDTTVTDHPYVETPVLTVGGINAQVVLDNATFTQSLKYNRGYVAAVCVGGRDGDGTFTLQNGAEFTHTQTMFVGGVSRVAPLDDNDTNAHICGSYLSTEGEALFRDKAGAEGGFSNPFVGSTGTRPSTGTVNVLSGSKYNSGIGFYAGNGTINVDGEGSVINSGVRAASADYTWFGWVQSPVAKTVVNITNGGVFNVGVQAAQSLYTTYYSDSTAEINISGRGSALNVSGVAYIACGTAANCRTSIRVDDHGTLHAAQNLLMSYRGQNSSLQVTNGGDVVADAQFKIGANGWVDVDAASTVHANQTYLLEGAAFFNRGTIARNESVAELPESFYVALGRGSRFQTGTATLSGREDPNREDTDPVDVRYATGLDGVTVSYCDTGSADKAVTIGALLEGDTVMQYIKKADIETINAAVKAGLALEDVAGYELKFLHEVGKLVTLEYTTDELNKKDGEERLVVAGGTVLVSDGEKQDLDTKVGTIGSYRDQAAETTAHLAVSETQADSVVFWHGTGMETVAGETAFFNKDFNLDIKDGAGTLTVVTDSELVNESDEIKARITVQDGAVLSNRGVLCFDTVVKDGGTLKGAGTIATTTVNGNLVVGNSPGLLTATGNLTLTSGSNTTFSVAGLEFPSTEELEGWDSGTYSRISLQVGASLVLQEGVRQFTIEFGGEDLLGSCLPGGQDTPVTLNLLLAEGSVTLPQGYVGQMTEYGLDVTELIDSVFRVTTDVAAGQGTADNMYVNFHEGDYHYYVNQGEGGTYNLTLCGHGTITRVPEPATGTLGLLALCALVGRRPRKH